jgi:hypothetical protein
MRRCTHTHTHTHENTHKHTCTHTNIHTHTHIHTQLQRNRRARKTMQGPKVDVNAPVVEATNKGAPLTPEARVSGGGVCVLVMLVVWRRGWRYLLTLSSNTSYHCMCS